MPGTELSTKRPFLEKMARSRGRSAHTSQQGYNHVYEQILVCVLLSPEQTLLTDTSSAI